MNRFTTNFILCKRIGSNYEQDVRFQTIAVSGSFLSGTIASSFFLKLQLKGAHRKYLLVKGDANVSNYVSRDTEEEYYKTI